jgi:predicted transcriptional regulator
MKMKTPKEEVRELLERLPDDTSIEDIQYHLYVRQKVHKGLQAAKDGRTVPHEEAVRRLSKWLEK